MLKTIHLADTKTPICRLEVKKHFDSLTNKEKHYAHYLSHASWAGSRILAGQLSDTAQSICDMLIHVLADRSRRSETGSPVLVDLEALAQRSTVSNEHFQYFLEYASQALFNVGNYRSFGDTKFIPRLPEAEFAKIIAASGSNEAQALFAQLGQQIYALLPEQQLLLGYPADGHVSGYYSRNVDKEDIEFVQKFIEQTGLSALNTRLFKASQQGSSEPDFTVAIASADMTKESQIHEFEGRKIQVQYGDFKEQMTKIADNMQKAIPFAANDNQKNMLEAYVKSFRSGSIEEHKESQMHWIKDVKPVVESNIGFIETYRDPAGVRAEWEGFVAVVNKEMTIKFETMVNNAHKFIELLPWPKDFEKDVFRPPDFTSLEVMSFATTGSPPAGINIPNYDDVRQNFGFKNVSLGNVLNAKAAGEKVTFIHPEDLALFEKYRGEAFELQVGLHELLGHGSGKLLGEETPGKFNFDVSNPPISPINQQPIKTWYKPGETWGSVFKSIAASYEECRAECVAMYLCLDKHVLSIFGHEGQEGDDIIYASYLTMARAGLTALEFYEPKSLKWGQAHMQARYAILRVFIQCGLVKLQVSENNIVIHMDRSKIATVGVKAIGDFLMRLNVYKATADAQEGTRFYVDATTVSQEHVEIRDIVLEQKQPRKMFVQANTFIDEAGQVVLKEYEPTLAGVIQSYVERSS